MTLAVTAADMLEVMDSDDLTRLDPAGTRLPARFKAGVNDIFSIVGRRYAVPTVLPATGGFRQAVLQATRYHLYPPDQLTLPSAGFTNPKHPVVYDYERAIADANAVLNFEKEWPELVDAPGPEEGAWGSEKPVFYDPTDPSLVGD